MVDFSDRDDIKRWLDAIEPAKRRREVAVAMAARAALRVTPLLGLELTRSQATVPSGYVLASLRATALPWAAAKYPAYDSELHAAASAAVVYVFAVGGAYAASARAAVRAAIGAVTATYGDAHVYPDAATDACTAARAAADAVGTAAAGTADAAATADADLIDAGRSGSELMRFPLWSTPVPDWATEAWEDLRAALLAADEGWEVWIDWYEARLAGDADHPPYEALEIARATIPEEIWNQGPEVVNAEIKRLIAEHEGGAPVVVSLQGRGASMSFAAGQLAAAAEFRGASMSFAAAQFSSPAGAADSEWLAPIESIPEQERTGTRFDMDAQGRIDVVRTPPATDDSQRLHYDEMRHKAEHLAGLGQMLGDIAPDINRILEALPEHIEDASVDKLWSRGNTLRRCHDAHVRTVDNNLWPDPARLDSVVGARLGDFIDSFNVFVIGDPRGLELDRIRLGPQDREAARKIAALAAPIARAANPNFREG